MLNKLMALGAVAVLAFAPACGLVEGAREDLATMEEQEFRDLVQSVNEAGAKGGVELVKQLELSMEDRAAVAGLARALADTVINDDLGAVDDVVRLLLDRFGDEIGNAQAVSILEDATNLIDAAIGQVSVGIDGLLTSREKELVFSLLVGVHNGVMQP